MGIYSFKQNNSGGEFVVDEVLCNRVYIEADSAEKANEKAENLGIYFNGVDEHVDCSCCGNRWSPVDESEELTKLIEHWKVEGYLVSEYGKTEREALENLTKKFKEEQIMSVSVTTAVFGRIQVKAKIKFESVEDYVQYLANTFGWTSPDGRIFYEDGKVVSIYSQGE